jgi:hypothetical protein
MDTVTKGLVALAIVAWGAAGYFAVVRPTPVGPLPVEASAPPPPPPPATATASAPAPALPPSPSTCMVSMMAPDTFKVPPELDGICEQENPFKAFSAIKSAVVGAAGDRLTEGAREFAGLGWYELAALAALRARCCPAPATLAWPFALACPVDEAMSKLEQAIAEGDAEAIAETLDAYRVQTVCLYKFGQGKNFGRDAMPGAEKAAFDKIFARGR